MKIESLWPIESLLLGIDFKRFVKDNTLQLFDKNQSGIRHHGQCPFCYEMFISKDNPKIVAFELLTTTGKFKCSYCEVRGDFIDLQMKCSKVRTREEAIRLIAEMHHITPTFPLGIYRHYKGKEYLVTGAAQHSETNGWMVLYRPLYENYSLVARPLTMFFENIQKG